MMKRREFSPNISIGGFTLMELVIVIVVLGILSVATVAWLDKKMNLDAQARQLAADIRYVQYLSMTKAERYRINFSSTQYALTKRDGTTAVFHPGSNTNIITLGTGITLATSGLPNSYLVFDRQGVPYTDSVLPGTALAAAATITLSSNGYTKVVTVTPETGKVSVN